MRLAHLSLGVADQQASRRFYETFFGFDCDGEPDMEGFCTKRTLTASTWRSPPGRTRRLPARVTSGSRSPTPSPCGNCWIGCQRRTSRPATYTRARAKSLSTGRDLPRPSRSPPCTPAPSATSTSARRLARWRRDRHRAHVVGSRARSPRRHTETCRWPGHTHVRQIRELGRGSCSQRRRHPLCHSCVLGRQVVRQGGNVGSPPH